MNRRRHERPQEWRGAGPLLATIFFLLSGTVSAQSSEWPQWGGPQRNFKSDAKGLASAWPPTGPRRLWSRSLGDGYSAITVEGGRLYTMYRQGEQEVVIALEAASGKTLWEYRYDAPFTKEYSMENGPGPHATPLVIGPRVFAVGATGKLHCLEKQTGRVVWSHDLINEFQGTVRVNGYACSPLAYRDTVILMVGGPGHAVMAFGQQDGAVVWQHQDFKNSPSSPLLINVEGQEQLVVFMFDEVAGVDPRNGSLLWSYPHQTDFGLNVSTPVWGEDNLLFCSSAYNGGSLVLKLTRTGGKTTAEKVWAHRLLRIHYSNAIRVGDCVYGSSGDFGTAPFTAINVKTGQVLWRDRSLSRASFVFADGRFVILDEDGHLALAMPTPEGLKIQAKVELLTNNAWTVPTLVGTTLYVRDRKTIMALDLK